MGFNFDAKQIGELANVKGGKRLPKDKSLVSTPTNHPYIRLVDIKNNLVDKSNLKYVDDITFSKISNYIVEEDDVCLAIVGNTIGLVFYIDKSMDGANLTENAVRIKFKDNLIPRYAYYYLISMNGQNQIKSRIVGSAQGKLPLYNVKNIEIPVPPLEEQKYIVDFLWNIDKKFSTNEKIISKLEEVSQTLFKRWFVDFEFPNENGEPYKSSGGKMKESALGIIPENWIVKDLCQVTNEVTRGITPKYTSEDKDLPIINQKVNKGEILEFEHLKYFDKSFPVPENKFAYTNDILINSLGQGTLGRVNLFLGESKKMLVDQHISIVRVDKEYLSAPYTYLALKSDEYQQRIEASITGSTGMIMLNINKIRSLKVLVPTSSVLKEFSEKVTPLFIAKNNFSQSNENLVDLLNLLLPKLLAGEISGTSKNEVTNHVPFP